MKDGGGGGGWRGKWGDAHGDECPGASGVMAAVGVVGILPHKKTNKEEREGQQEVCVCVCVCVCV